MATRPAARRHRSDAAAASFAVCSGAPRIPVLPSNDQDIRAVQASFSDVLLVGEAGSVFESGPDRATAAHIHRDSNKRIQEKEWRIKNRIEILKAKHNAASVR
ncbi:hypothetical protein BTK96_006179 [Burkholderia pyrrocinia]|uniref:hypothetical protein n=1 Tax=Burkholderia sp. IT-111MI5 TaxID=3026439 RepID=UPI002A2C3E18|nr:hypothetical protein [Burkholderia pyrrocinia]EKS9892919.1 hypothetical protein [Burkholderia pyrrocinia]EKS9905427.1 hypothetical protein [Burkholderia pyrrocinia]